MRHISAFILIIALLAQNFSRYVVILNYELNKDYIAKNLCENRKKPKSCCVGKCYLKKQLAKTDKEQSPASGTNSQKQQQEVFFIFKEDISRPDFATSELSTGYSTYNFSFTPQNYYGSVFHPPQV